MPSTQGCYECSQTSAWDGCAKHRTLAHPDGYSEPPEPRAPWQVCMYGCGTTFTTPEEAGEHEAGCRLTTERLAAKVAWEGGVYEALVYGIRSSDIADPAIAALWREMEEHYEAMAPIARKIDKAIKGDS